MRETIGSTWTFQLMFGFILLFVSFLAITISYSKAFRIKNEITSIIEKYGGYNHLSAPIIQNYVNSLGYSNTGKCGPSNTPNSLGIIGVNNLNDFSTSRPSDYDSNKRYYYCIKKETVRNGTLSNTYYEITLFYHFSIPLAGDIATFTVKGKTSDMTNYKDDLFDDGLIWH